MSRRRLNRGDECRILREAFITGTRLGCTPAEAMKLRAKYRDNCGTRFTDPPPPPPAPAALPAPAQGSFEDWDAPWMGRN